MPFNLRPYQENAVTAVFNEWNKEDVRATLLVCATGLGKTIIFSDIAKKLSDQGKKVLIVAHRGELLEQAREKLEASVGLQSSLEKAESRASLSDSVVVASVQTLFQDHRLEAFPRDHFDVIIVDEAHHSTASTYTKIFEYFETAKILGVTATPDRGDMKTLRDVYDSLAFEYGMIDGMNDGYLSKMSIQTIPVKIDITNVAMQTGDFAAGELGTVLDFYLETIADEMTSRCMNRKTLVFLPLVATSKKFCEILNRKGFSAAEVDGQSTDRKEIIEDFERGRYNVLCNSMLLTEGFDSPAIDCVINLRATKSRSLFQQIVGRGTRLCEGKENLLLLDFLWLTKKHDLCRPSQLFTDNSELADMMTELSEDGEARDAKELEELAREEILARRAEVIRKREEALAKALEDEKRKAAERLAMSKKETKRFGSVRFKERKTPLMEYFYDEYDGEFVYATCNDNDLLFLSIGETDLTYFEPKFAWEMKPVTENQLNLIKSFGVSTECVQFRGQAVQIIDTLFKRREAGLCTIKQGKMLSKYGFRHINKWTFEEAGSMISKISANHWKVPKFINPYTYKRSRG